MSLLRGVAEAAKVAGVTAGSKPTALNPAAAKNLKGMIDAFHCRIVEVPGRSLTSLHEQFFRKFFADLPSEVRGTARMPSSANHNDLRLELEKLRPLAPPPPGAVLTGHQTNEYFWLVSDMLDQGGVDLTWKQEQRLKKFLDGLPPANRNGAQLSDVGTRVEERGWIKVRQVTVQSDLPNGNAGLMALMQVNLFA